MRFFSSKKRDKCMTLAPFWMRNLDFFLVNTLIHKILRICLKFSKNLKTVVPTSLCLFQGSWLFNVITSGKSSGKHTN